MEAWLEARSLSSKQLATRARAEDVHVPLVGADGQRRVVRCVTCEALRAYRMLPSFMRVRLLDTSPSFVAGNARESVYVEYEDATPLEGENPSLSLRGRPLTPSPHRVGGAGA